MGLLPLSKTIFKFPQMKKKGCSGHQSELLWTAQGLLSGKGILVNWQWRIISFRNIILQRLVSGHVVDGGLSLDSQQVGRSPASRSIINSYEFWCTRGPENHFYPAFNRKSFPISCTFGWIGTSNPHQHFTVTGISVLHSINLLLYHTPLGASTKHASRPVYGLG